MLLGRKGFVEFGMELFMKVGAEEAGVWELGAAPVLVPPGLCPGAPLPGERDGEGPFSGSPPGLVPLKPGPLAEGTAWFGTGGGLKFPPSTGCPFAALDGAGP